MKIKCPNCKKSSDITNGICPECNFNVYDYMYKNGFSDGNRLIFDKVYVCTKCGCIDASNSIDIHCRECDSIYKPSNISREEYRNNLPYFFDEKNERHFVDETVGNTIDWNLYNSKKDELYKISKESIEYQTKQQKREQEKLITRCPKCNGTSFTPVRKKFSLFAGFATNKIELVCNNCGIVVKPK